MSTPTTAALQRHGITPAARESLISARLRGFSDGVLLTLAATAVALLIARAPVTDVETSAAMDAENARHARIADARKPCLDELPWRVALTQALVDQLCIKPQPTGRAPAITVPATPRKP